jgi:uncharacterized RDD family membrane protein YckC
MQTWPGARLGLPEKGPRAVASWGGRFAALLIDWSASMLVAMALVGTSVMTASDWRLWLPMMVFFVEKSAFTALIGCSFGQRIMHLAVITAGGGRLEPWRAIVRSGLVCLVIPAIIVGADRRGLNDLLLDTVVVTTK